ncbi:uncharacterized protein LOC113373797 [Ctenocephalides felis]|uniref:uncharacterized protein LOC113373797 n=1 Tax=Ctenocephalides felis TaxID=7515 RepID=UPI000E6E41CC|nr:uncharacterized protein LOC113373797 [Ctenocephalides felis]
MFKKTIKAISNVSSKRNVSSKYNTIVQQRSNLPVHGDCWKNAVLQLNHECKSLTEDVQQDLSLRFTNCFLEMSGQQTYNCFSDKKPNLRRICIDSMSDRAFNVYTEFYSHTQNMCFYLYNKIWHEKAEETINLLNSNTQYVNEQLELAKNLQANLLEQQQRGLEIQDILMRQGKKLSSELEISHNYVQNIAQNFTTSTKEHSNLLFDIISKINYIQKWVLGEMTWMSNQYSAANYKNFPECLEKIDHKINPTNLIYKTDEDENTVAFTDHNNYNETTEDNSLTTCKLKLRNRKIIMENNTNRTPRLRAKVAKATKA